MITPKPLFPGARVALVCASSAVPEDRLEPALEAVRALGLEPVPYPSCYFANRHEEAIWLAKTNDYYFDLDSVRVPYSEEELKFALKDKRLNPENTLKGKNPTNVWQIGRLNGNSKERVGHPTQKPVEIIRRFVKSLSYPGSVVLDFFAGSGTVGRVCLEEGRHCLMCDNDVASKNYFNAHLEKMRELGLSTDYIEIDNPVELIEAAEIKK